MTTAITNIDPTGDARRILGAELTVPNGETVEVDDEIAERLLQQPDIWARAEKTSGKKTANTGDEHE